ncbi:Sucrose synthase [Zostera marina]|uniref:sucrose synthase n=1 Tax=Zostera marina TaxID=29655 RepID=A0A0K9NHW9_ZOSMR|nr:Sucrose synthase [Zostera marina]
MEHTYILRVPFKSENGAVLRKWITRFNVRKCDQYVNLSYSQDVASKIATDLNRLLTLLLGIIATETSLHLCYPINLEPHSVSVQLCMHWRKQSIMLLIYSEEKYHFSCQFIIDLIATNNADFIITSTYQELARR